MNTKKYRKTEKSLRAFFRKYQIDPDTLPVPNFEKFKREYLDKMAPITEEERKSIMERNRQLLLKRARKKRMIVSMAACAVVAVGVVGSALWLGRENAVAPGPESSGNEGNSVIEESVTPNTDKEETSGTRLSYSVVTYEEAVRLTGLPLVKADEMVGFEGYRISMLSEKIFSVNYYFESGFVDVYISSTDAPALVNTHSVQYADKTFEVQETLVNDIGNRLTIYHNTKNTTVFVGTFTNIPMEKGLQILNFLVF